MTTEFTLDSAVTVLTALLHHTPWYQPIQETQTEALRACAIFVHDFVDAMPNPGMDHLALMGCMSALINWLIDPEDESRISRFRRAWEVYSDLYDLVDET